jgi:hypothetical protein
MAILLLAQLGLLAFHQATTLCDFFPFNGARFTKRSERLAEAAVNLALMALPPIGFGFGVRTLMIFGCAYYFILFAVECATWWAPCAFGASREWLEVYERVHAGTLGVLPRLRGRTVPNMEHLVLMAMTAFAAGLTLHQFRVLHAGPFPHPWVAWFVGLGLTAGTAARMVGRANRPRPPASPG